MYGFIVGIAILALQVRFGVVSKTGVTGSWWAFLGPYLGSIILAYMFHVSRSAWQLHEAQATSIEDLKRRVEAMNRIRRYAIIQAMASTSLAAGQSEVVTATPEDSNGNTALLETGNVPTWESSDITIATVAAASDGLSAKLTGVKAGSCTVTVDGISSFASGTVSGSFGVTVTENPASTFGFAFGSPA